MKKLLLGLAILFSIAVFGQKVIISDDSTYQGSEKAILDIHSSTDGLLIPRLTTSQRDSIANPPAGLIIFNSDVHKLQLYAGTITLDTIDQLLTQVNTNADSISQQITPLNSGSLLRVDLWIKHNTGGTITVSIKDGSTPQTGSVLASEQITATTSFQEYNIQFSNPPVLSAGNTYLLHMSDNGLSGLLSSESTWGDPYSGGSLFFNTVQVPGADLKFRVLLRTDMTVNTISQANATTYTGGTNTVSQQFIAEITGEVFAAKVSVRHTNPGTIALELRSGSTPSSSTLLASENITVTTSFQEYFVYFPSAPEVSTGQSYILRINDNAASGNVYWEATFGDPYPQGYSFFDGNVQTTVDLKFEVWSIYSTEHWQDLN